MYLVDTFLTLDTCVWAERTCPVCADTLVCNAATLPIDRPAGPQSPTPQRGTSAHSDEMSYTCIHTCNNVLVFRQTASRSMTRRCRVVRRRYLRSQSVKNCFPVTPSSLFPSTNHTFFSKKSLSLAVAAATLFAIRRVRPFTKV